MSDKRTHHLEIAQVGIIKVEISSIDLEATC